jgi:UDP-N-acetylmuramoyl-tripeptide--D-alanyl-D-alanine ligase
MIHSSPLWTAQDICHAVSGTCTGDFNVHGISIDSRTIKTGDLFIALVGDNFDGHTFAKDALAAGAYAVMVQQRLDTIPETQQIIVENTENALRALAMAARARMTGKIIAITGSVGKTSTKEMLSHVLAPQGRVHATIGNLNNHLGVPLTLARMPQDTDYAIIEMGMNHPGEIRPLSKMAQPHCAIITTVANAHLEFFSDVIEIARAKAEILDGLPAGAIAIVHREAPGFAAITNLAYERDVRLWTFGRHLDSTLRLMDYAIDPDCTRVFGLLWDTAAAYHIGAPGKPWAFNSLAVLGAVEAVGGDWVAAKDALASMTPPSGRGLKAVLPYKNGDVALYDESYNASPIAVEAALQTFRVAPVGKDGIRHIVLGDMLELGKTAPTLHAALAKYVQTVPNARLHTAGKLMRHLYNSVPDTIQGLATDTAAELAAQLPDIIQAGDAVLVKGSAGSKMSTIIHTLKACADAQDSRVA